MLLKLLAWLIVIQAALVAACGLVVIGPERLRALPELLRSRIRRILVPSGVLLVVLLLNGAVRRPAVEASWLIGLNITPYLYSVEGTFVARLQSLATPWLTATLSYVYVHGYVFVLVFPVIAYLALERLRPFRLLAVAYSLNYLIGLVCYVLFIAYGPRNMIDSVQSLLYVSHPSFQLLTSEVNANTNVFPSLHSSLATTVVLLAYETRREYPTWLALSTVVAGAILVSTMYLGIHWATDVVAGVVLAVISVRLAQRIVGPGETSSATVESGNLAD